MRLFALDDAAVWPPIALFSPDVYSTQAINLLHINWTRRHAYMRALHGLASPGIDGDDELA